MAIAAMLVMMVADAETKVHRSDVGAEDVGVCARRAKQREGEHRGDQQFHG